MSKSPFINRLLQLFFLSSLCVVMPGIQACAPATENQSNRTRVLAGPTNTTYPMPPAEAKALPQMGWVSAAGQRITVSSYRDKVLVLDFYATWCMPCRDSVPHLLALQHRYGPQGLAIVGLNVGGPDDQAAVPEFAREFKIDYQLGLPDEELANLLLSDSEAIPQTFVFDRQGQLVKRYVGYGDSTAIDLERTIRAALNLDKL